MAKIKKIVGFIPRPTFGFDPGGAKTGTLSPKRELYRQNRIFARQKRTANGISAPKSKKCTRRAFFSTSHILKTDFRRAPL
jgi:hypothetical protein